MISPLSLDDPETSVALPETLVTPSDRSRSVPRRPWRLRQRWTQVLFTHWPVRPTLVQARLPAGLTVDTFDGWAWLGVVPFVMDRIRVRTVGEHSLSIPGATAFPELNLRTYVRAPDASPGVYFFSLDAASLLGVLGARIAFGLPYVWARMESHTDPRDKTGAITYRSHRLLGGRVDFSARYRSLNLPSPDDDLRRFLTERYALFVRRFGAIQVGHIQHGPWQLQQAEAEILHDDLPASFGLPGPDRPRLLHYGPEVHMQAWTLRRVPGSTLPRSVYSDRSPQEPQKTCQE